MYRLRSSVPYDILHGIQFPANLTTMLVYLSYFPPPPPVLPGPPSRRSWACSSRPYPSSSCFVSDDRNPAALRQYIPLIANNDSLLFKNTSHISINSPNHIKPSSLIDLIPNQYLFIFILILIFSIFFSILFIYFRRHRQRQLTSNNHTETNNKKAKFYHRLIPRREKHQTNNNEHNSIRLRTHHQHSPKPQFIRISTAKEIPTNDHHESEEAV